MFNFWSGRTKLLHEKHVAEFPVHIWGKQANLASLCSAAFDWVTHDIMQPVAVGATYYIFTVFQRSR